MAVKQTVLEALTRPRLADLVRRFDVGSAPAGLAKADLVSRLVRCRSATLEALLAALTRDELKAACIRLGLPADGRDKQTLTDRILGNGQPQRVRGGPGNSTTDRRMNEQTPAATAGQAGNRQPEAPVSGGTAASGHRPGAAAGGPQIPWGPDNPHPLSTLKTELIWEGKYDEYGNRREVDIAGCAMPLQKIETVDQPRSEAAAAGQLEMFDRQTCRRDDFRNRLIWGDNKLVMASLLKEFKGTIDLIYIDPPFDVGADFTMQVAVGDEEETVEKDQSALEMVAYRDMWGRGTDSYLTMMHDRLALMRELLAAHGTIYVQCDYRTNYLQRLILEDVFGKERFIAEVVWKRRSGIVKQTGTFGSCTDSIMVFSKTDTYVYNRQFTKVDSEDYVEERFKYTDEKGRRYRLSNLVNPGFRPTLCYEYKGFPPPPNGWAISRERMEEFDREGKLEFPKKPGGRIQRRQYLDEWEGYPVQNLWTDIYQINPVADERLDFPTQKPESLLRRIIEASSNPGDLIGDFFCGSGTTGVVAERLGRRWIMADLGRFAIHTSRKRLIELQRSLHAEGKPYRAFDVYNLGRYERQWWQQDALKGADDEHRRVVLEFYRAEPIKSTSPLIHGRKGSALVHVDSIDTMFTRDEATAVAKAAKEAGAKEVACLSWEFEMDLRLHTQALESELGVKLKLIPIPREIMERNRKEPPPFLEMAVLEAEPVYRKQNGKRTVDIKLTKFMPSLAEVPSKELEALKERAVKSGFDFIDFWAVDFDYHDGRPFSHHWQDYRTRKDRSLKTVSDQHYAYVRPGKYTACVKVVDIFGCDTSITVGVDYA